MVCYKDCTKCGEQEDCSLDGDIDLKYPFMEMVQNGKDLLTVIEP